MQGPRTWLLDSDSCKSAIWLLKPARSDLSISSSRTTDVPPAADLVYLLASCAVASSWGVSFKTPSPTLGLPVWRREQSDSVAQ